MPARATVAENPQGPGYVQAISPEEMVGQIITAVAAGVRGLTPQQNLPSNMDTSVPPPPLDQGFLQMGNPTGVTGAPVTVANGTVRVLPAETTSVKALASPMVSEVEQRGDLTPPRQVSTALKSRSAAARVENRDARANVGASAVPSTVEVITLSPPDNRGEEQMDTSQSNHARYTSVSGPPPTTNQSREGTNSTQTQTAGLIRQQPIEIEVDTDPKQKLHEELLDSLAVYNYMEKHPELFGDEQKLAAYNTLQDHWCQALTSGKEPQAPNRGLLSQTFANTAPFPTIPATDEMILAREGQLHTLQDVSKIQTDAEEEREMGGGGYHSAFGQSFETNNGNKAGTGAAGAGAGGNSAEGFWSNEGGSKRPPPGIPAQASVFYPNQVHPVGSFQSLPHGIVRLFPEYNGKIDFMRWLETFERLLKVYNIYEDASKRQLFCIKMQSKSAADALLCIERRFGGNPSYRQLVRGFMKYTGVVESVEDRLQRFKKIHQGSKQTIQEYLTELQSEFYRNFTTQEQSQYRKMVLNTFLCGLCHEIGDKIQPALTSSSLDEAYSRALATESYMKVRDPDSFKDDNGGPVIGTVKPKTRLHCVGEQEEGTDVAVANTVQNSGPIPPRGPEWQRSQPQPGFKPRIPTSVPNKPPQNGSNGSYSNGNNFNNSGVSNTTRSELAKLPISELAKMIEALVSKLGDVTPKRSNPNVDRRITCYNCGGFGHIATKCPSIVQGGSSFNRTTAPPKVNQLDGEQEEQLESDDPQMDQ
jgi:hypothetical protein